MTLIADLSAGVEAVVRFVSINWMLIAFITLGGVTNYLNLPKGHRTTPKLGMIFGLATIPTAWYMVAGAATPLVETILYSLFMLLTFMGAGGLATKPNPVHGALMFAVSLLGTCVLYAILGAPFLMAATLIIYAGAIVVTFLFVIMLAHQAGMSTADHLTREPFLAVLTTSVLLAALAFVISRSYIMSGLDSVVAKLQRAAEAGTMQEMEQILGSPQEFSKAFEDVLPEVNTLVPKDRGTRAYVALNDAINSTRKQWGHQDPATMKKELLNVAEAAWHVRSLYGHLQAPEGLPVSRNVGYVAGDKEKPLPAANVAGLGKALFTDYLLAVELAGVLLLVATIGALAIASRRVEEAA